MLIVIFVLGPCELLIPLPMFPAATYHLAGVLFIAAIFGVATVGTMVGVVAVGLAGVERLPLGCLERYSHALAGGALVLSSLLIVGLGL